MGAEQPPVRVIFAGGKAVGCGVLRHLIASPLANVVGVVVNPNDADKGQWYPAASAIARQHDIPVHVSHNVNSPEELAWMRALEPTLGIAAYFDQILSRRVFALPAMGWVNLHLASAEQYRGCYPTTWALINGETSTGVTLHRVTEEIDGGEILAECEVMIDPADTGLSLYNKCTLAGVAMFGTVLPELLSGSLQARPQRPTATTRYYNRQFPSHEICFNGDAQAVLNRIRALYFPPFPPPYIKLGDKKFLVVEAPDDTEDAS